MSASKVQTFAGYSIRPFGDNARLVTTHDQGYVLVSYHTPVAVYDRETDVLCRTETQYTRATTAHIRDFGATFRPGKVQDVPQEYVTGLLRKITGFPELSDNPAAHYARSDDRYTCTGRDDCDCIGCSKDRY